MIYFNHKKSFDPAKKRITRRGFLKKASGAAIGAISFPYIISSSALGKAGIVAPSNRITIGFIGIGAWGKRDLSDFLNKSDTQVVAVCDVNGKNREAAQRQVDDHYGKKVCAAYNDFRELLERDDIDAVAIVSPDHWHVPHAVWAARAGKDVYLEKPMGLSVEQDKVLRDTIRRYKRVFQFGPEQRSLRSCRFACELVQNGRIGKLRTIKVRSPASVSSENYPPMPVPDWLDYEMWLGPAPWAPYTERRVLSRSDFDKCWWYISDYSLGMVANWGIHCLDIAQWGGGFDNTGPVEIEGTGVFPRDGLCDCATSWNVEMTYANGVKVNFTDAVYGKHGVWFEGDEGWVFASFNRIDAHPKSLLKSVIGPDEIHLPVTKSLERDFLDCIKTRHETVCPVETAVRSDTVCHLSDIAMRLGRKLKWNPQKEEFINDAEANRMLSRPMRSPWQL